MATKSTKPVTSKELSNSAKALGSIVKSINSRTKAHYVETGRDLIRASEILPHGKLGPWLKENFGWSPSTARNYMNAAKFVDKSAKAADLQPSAVMALSAPSVPEAIVNEVLADLDAGLRPTVTAIKAKIASAKTPKPSKDPTPASAPVSASKSSYQDLVDLLKEVGLNMAKDALKEAFAGTTDYKPAPPPEAAAESQMAVREPATGPSPASDDELADLDLSKVAMKEAA